MTNVTVKVYREVRNLILTSIAEVLNVKNEVKKNAQNMVNFGRTIKIND